VQLECFDDFDNQLKLLARVLKLAASKTLSKAAFLLANT